MLSQSSSLPVTFKFKTRDLTPVEALEEVDYAKYVNQSVTIDAGQTSKDFFIQILVDEIDEYDQRFEIVLSDAANAVINDNVAVGTILDDDAAPEIFLDLVEAGSLEEGDTGEHQRTAVLSLSRETEKIVTVDAAIEQLAAPGINQVAAVKDRDFREGTAHITFSPGDENQDLTITVIGDGIDEENEIIGIRVTAADNATFPEAPFELAILDDDASPIISIANETVVEQHSGNAVVTMTITLAGVTERTVTVDYAIAAGTATEVEDYSGISGQASFAPTVTERYVNITVFGDIDIEPDETVRVELSGPVYCTIDPGATSAVLTIENDDYGPEFSSSLEYRSIGYTEDLGAKVGAPVEALDFDFQLPFYSIIGGAGDEFFDVESTTGQILVGGNLSLTTESLYTLVLQAEDYDGHTDQTTVIIEILPTVGIAGDIFGVESTGDTITLTFTRYANSIADPLEVHFAPVWQKVFPYTAATFQNIGSANLADLNNDAGRQQLVSGTIIIPSNQPSISITLTPNADGVVEDGFEVFAVKVVASPNADYEPLPIDDPVDPSDFKKVASVTIVGQTHVLILDGVQLFVTGASDTAAIDKNDVNQGSIGDCWFMAAIAALAEKEPSTIQNLFQSNPNGGYDVMFPGHTVHVDLTLDMSRTAADLGGDVSATGAVEVWPLLLEKAYAEAFGGGYGGMSAGGSASDVWANITGRSVIYYNETSPQWSGTSNSNGINFEALIAAGNKVVVGTKDGAALPLYGDHAYVLLEIFDDGGTRRARLYNPWGSEVTVSLGQMWQSIDSISVQAGAP
ncbi:MAG: Calx-beta domain-containing protein [Pirellulaceae bacterium]